MSKTQQSVTEPCLHHVEVNGARLAYFERGQPQRDKPTLLFVHATGFHARVWDYHAEALPDYHTIALDQRGHGRSEKLAVDNWSTFGEDQAGFVQALGLSNVIGIAHSMGAHGMIEGAALSGGFARLLLCDPTVAEPEAYAPEYAEMFGDALHPAAKRRNQFSSVDDMYNRLKDKSSFPHFHPRILRDYCEYGLVQSEEGGFELACPPEIEARVYMSARSNVGIYDAVAKLDIPVTIVRARLPAPDAGQDFSSSPTWPGLAKAFLRGKDIHWPDCTHFIPMQRPDEVVNLIKQEIKQWHQAEN